MFLWCITIPLATLLPSAMSVQMARGDYSNVPDNKRTPDKDRAAKEIEEWKAQGKLPMSAAEMERQGEYSAQHYRNTLSAGYFDEEELQGNGNGLDDGNGGTRVRKGGLSIDIPEGVQSERSYLRGFIDGYLHEPDRRDE